MKLSPLDIKRQQFGKAFRGYEPDEVDAFVTQVASQWESVLDELRLATERNRELEQKLKHYERVELALQEALETARETARRSEEAAERKAKIIIEQAELKADRTLQDVEQERFGLRRDIAKLTGRQNEVAARLRAFLMSELEILAQFQGDDPVGFIRLESSNPRAAAPDQLEAHEPIGLATGAEASDLGAQVDLDAATEDPSADAEPSAAAAQTADAPEAETAEAPETEEPAAEEPAAEEPAAAEPAADVHTPPEEPASHPVAERAEEASAPEDRAAQPSSPASSMPPPTPVETAAEPFDWDLPETVEPDLQSDAGSDWNLRTLVTGEPDSVAGSEAERERIRRILEDLD